MSETFQFCMDLSNVRYWFLVNLMDCCMIYNGHSRLSVKNARPNVDGAVDALRKMLSAEWTINIPAELFKDRDKKGVRCEY